MMDRDYIEMAECLDCGWHGRAEHLEDIEVGYPSHGLEPDWQHERCCPECGSVDRLSYGWMEV